VNEQGNALQHMLEARSVAVVGASLKPGSLGRQMMLELERGGFSGSIYPVNPGYQEVLGHRCFPSIAQVPEPVDLVMLGVSNARIEQTLQEAADAGARSAVTFSSLYEEPSGSAGTLLPERVAAIARASAMSLCGGNGMGFINMDTSLRATGFATPEYLRPGPVTFISHSGSAFAALAFNRRNVGFNLLISSGQEIVTGLADYMAYSLAQPTTKVLALLIETVREPQPFRDQLARAAQTGVPVVALKVGRTDGSKVMVTAHSGALAGEDGAFEAVFDAHGVLRVRTLDEMADVMELLSCPRRVTSGTGIATVHDSGGERTLLADLAADLGVGFAAISDVTRERIQQVLDPGLVAENPLDAWGTGIDADAIFLEALKALHDDPDTAAVALAVDLTHEEEIADSGYIAVAHRTFASTTKPFCVISNLSATVDLAGAQSLRDAGIPVLEGASSALVALRLLIEDRDNRERPAIRMPEPAATDVQGWRSRLRLGDPLSELEGLSLLGDYGIQVIHTEAATTEEAALSGAEAVGGFPVALKTAAPRMQHKSDVGGVRLNLQDAQQLLEAYREISSRLGPHVTVSAMAPKGVEVALGVVSDPQFGPLVLVGAGGVLVELLKDRRLALPPIDQAGALRMLQRLSIWPLLQGVRGGPGVDVAALVDAISRLSVLATDLGDLLDGLDVNPVIAGPGGCLAVDALVLPRAAG
jgi:acetate---CoA ligase (ADP-forming)